MLKITVPGLELYDESKNEFINYKDQILQLEHSLVSISKWEAKWHKPFLSDEDKTLEEIIDYIKCMTITQNVKSDVYDRLTSDNIQTINDYIQDPMTATTFSDDKKKTGKKEIVTSEVIYYWMVTYNIPMECQKWHLNRLLTLVKVCTIKNSPPKKMSNSEIISRNKALNAARRKKMNTKG